MNDRDRDGGKDFLRARYNDNQILGRIQIFERNLNKTGLRSFF